MALQGFVCKFLPQNASRAAWTVVSEHSRYNMLVDAFRDAFRRNKFCGIVYRCRPLLGCKTPIEASVNLKVPVREMPIRWQWEKTSPFIMTWLNFHHTRESSMRINDERMIAAFKVWLAYHNSIVLPVTDSSELARFITRHGIGCIYRAANGGIGRMENGADEAWFAYRYGRAWQGSGPRHRKKRKRSGRLTLLRRIAGRDGWDCVYCGDRLTESTATVEHIDPFSGGGSEHISNMTLACRLCNESTGNMCARQKIEFAVSRRRSSSSASPERFRLPGLLNRLLNRR